MLKQGGKGGVEMVKVDRFNCSSPVVVVINYILLVVGVGGARARATTGSAELNNFRSADIWAYFLAGWSDLVIKRRSPPF